MKVSAAGKTTITALDRVHTNLGSIFQYLIGNTDFSPILAAPGEACCHNYVLLNPDDDDQRPQLSVPYDFDMSGIVNASHAQPNPRFKLRSVRTRLYRGRCDNNAYLESSLQAFRDRRQAINELVAGSPHMSAGTKRTVQKYIDDFYKTIDNPRAVSSHLTKKCI